MVLQTEIKDFVRKVLLLAILLSILVNLAFTYYRSVTGESTVSASSATTNETSFQRTGVPYLGDTGVAISLNIGLSDTDKKSIPVRLYEDVLPISQVLSDRSLGEKKIISSHMIAASEYLNVLKTDVRKLLDQSSDRAAMLESFLDQLKYRYTATNNYLSSLAAQKVELESALANAQTKTASAKE